MLFLIDFLESLCYNLDVNQCTGAIFYVNFNKNGYVSGFWRAD